MADNPGKEKPWWRSTRFRISVILAVAVGLIILGYWLPFPWIGFDSAVTPKPADVDYRPMRTIWDWLGLLIIPAALGVGGLLFSSAERKADREIAKERAENDQKIADERIRDSILREYLDRMSVLLIEQKLATSEKDSPVRNVARARTLTLLNALAGDGPRKGSVVQFLYEADLINVIKVQLINEANEASLLNKEVSLVREEASVVRLFGANLSDTNLSDTNLSEIYLNGANLSGANLSGADLSGANLGRANLGGADLSGAYLAMANLGVANLRGANLSDADLAMAHLIGANLYGAIVTDEQLNQARSLYKATMPDGSQHE
jgi:hypothetical protein